MFIGETIGDAVGQRLAAGFVRQEVAESLRRGGETTGHAHAGTGQLADHFAERGVLAADGFNIRHAQVFERGNVDCVVVLLLQCCVGHNYTFLMIEIFQRGADLFLVILFVVQHNLTIGPHSTACGELTIHNIR
jgi:hypothetical protein